FFNNNHCTTEKQQPFLHTTQLFSLTDSLLNISAPSLGKITENSKTPPSLYLFTQDFKIPHPPCNYSPRPRMPQENKHSDYRMFLPLPLNS
ncbi:MAG: hypothetical protein ACK53Y_27980, partial [bacterium]